MPGVVSIPHGWGHDAPTASQLSVAADARRAPTATCSPTRTLVDPLSGNAVLNGIPVELAPVPRPRPPPSPAGT